jgi:branched-chain amino acid transport system permease protein
VKAYLVVPAVLLGVLLLTAPLILSGYLLSVLVVILYFAYVGQAWNLMMGFAGQLSLGNALYVGLGAYASAALFVHFGIPPLVGLLAAMVLGGAAATFIGALAFRLRIGGVYLALLTIAFAEFTRILFAHFEWVGANSGFFLPVAHRSGFDLVNLRGGPAMFYYVALALAAAGLALSWALLRTRLGHYWLATRDDETAARSLGVDTFRCKLAAVSIGGAMTAIGGVFLAFYYNNLFPSDVFGMHRSIEIILGPIIGGLGTFMGPVIGAFVLGALGELATSLLEELGLQAAGAKQLLYAAVLFLIVKYMPGGLWPWMASRLGGGGGR